MHKLNKYIETELYIYIYIYIYIYPLAFGSPRHHALSRFQNSELYRKRIAGEYRRGLPFGALSEEKYFRFATPHQSPGNQQPARCIEKKV